MSDEERKVVNLAEVRDRKMNANGQLLFEQGGAFKFNDFEYSDDPPFGVGLLDGDMPICFMTSEDGMEGIRMSRDSAMKLGIALCEAAETDAPPEEDFIPRAPPKKGT